MLSMNKWLMFVGLFIFFSLAVSVQGATTTQTEYCINVQANDTYINVTADILFANSSLYGYRCFYSGSSLTDTTSSFHNVTINFNGFDLHANETHPNLIHGVYVSHGTNWTVMNGTINFTRHLTTGYGISLTSNSGADYEIYNVTVIGGATIGLNVVAGVDRLTVEDSSFTGSDTYDIQLLLPQTEITSCGNVWNSFNGAGSVLSKDSCQDPPASYKDYIYETNCTVSSDTHYGAVTCSNEFPIPSDCVNITTWAWTVITPHNDTWLQTNKSFTRWTCNPEGDRISPNCDNLYEYCTYGNLNSYPKVEWDDYAGGQNATSFHLVTIPDGCILYDTKAWFNVTGRLHLACKSFTQSGIEIDGESEACEHELVCYNSATMEERFEDCTSILTPCTYGCYDGVCSATPTTTIPDGDEHGALLDLDPYTAQSWIELIFTPVAIVTMFLVGLGAYFENQVDDSKGAIFLAIVCIGVIMFTYFGIYPVWIGVLLIIACSLILAKFILGVV